MNPVGVRFRVYTVGHFSVVRPLEISEVSGPALKLLAVHCFTWNSGLLHHLWDLRGFLLIQLFIHFGRAVAKHQQFGFLTLL